MTDHPRTHSKDDSTRIEKHAQDERKRIGKSGDERSESQLTLLAHAPTYPLSALPYSNPPWSAGEKKLVLPWSWPRNLYLVVRLMLALNGDGSGAGAGAGAVACADTPKAQSDKNDETMIDFFFIRAR